MEDMGGQRLSYALKSGTHLKIYHKLGLSTVPSMLYRSLKTPVQQLNGMIPDT